MGETDLAETELDDQDVGDSNELDDNHLMDHHIILDANNATLDLPMKGDLNVTKTIDQGYCQLIHWPHQQNFGINNAL